MDCIQAQSVISEALDGSPVDAAALDAAKSHCRECAQCGQFIRTLSAVRRAAPPKPPEDLADRVMAAIRAEAAATSQSSDLAAAASPALVPAPDSADAAGASATPSGVEAASDSASSDLAAGSSAGVPVTPSASRVSLGRQRMDRRQLITWGSAAAVLLVVVGVSAALGIMRLVGTTSTQVAMTDTGQRAAVETAPQLSSESAESLAGTADAGSLAPTPESAGAPANLYVNFNSDVYVLQGVSPQPKSELTQAGQTRMTFSADTPAALHVVYTGTEPDAIYIEDLNEMQRFTLVKRGYRGIVYTLRSGDISDYGSWPTVPPGIPLPVPPDNPTGAPTFVLDGQDASGTPVYRRTGSSRQSGIAIAPGTAAPDPAANNPGWTWWTP